MELIADHIPALVKCAKLRHRLHNVLITWLLSFLERIKSEKYGQRISVKFINGIQYFAQVIIFQIKHIHMI